MADKDPLSDIKALLDGLEAAPVDGAAVRPIKTSGTVAMTSGHEARNGKWTSMISDATAKIYRLADTIGHDTNSPGVVLSALVSTAYNIAREQKMLPGFVTMLADTADMLRDEVNQK